MVNFPISLEFQCRALPGADSGQSHDLRLGIQRGQEVADDVPANVAEAVFRFTLQARLDPDSGHPIFTGPYAQGGRADRFVYLCWGVRNGGQWRTDGRVKVPLHHLTWDRVQVAAANGQPIIAILRLTNAAGRPITATIKDEYIAWDQT